MDKFFYRQLCGIERRLEFFYQMLFLGYTSVVIFMSHLVKWDDNEFNCRVGHALCNMCTVCENALFSAGYMLPVYGHSFPEIFPSFPDVVFLTALEY